jgi:hypothetical protein
MYEMTQADRIWNRACGNDPLRTLPGDRALADLLRAHNLAMNGGVLHAVECLSASELSDAESGYRFYGLDAAASLLLRAKTNLDTDEDLEFYEGRLDGEYANIIPNDTSLNRAFERHFQDNPSDYSPLRRKDME